MLIQPSLLLRRFAWQSQVRRQFHGDRRAFVIADDDERKFVVERDACQLVFLARHDLLRANRFVFVDVQVEDEDAAFGGDSGKDGAGVRRPFNVADARAQVEDEQRIVAHVLPNLHAPVARARHEDVAVELVEVHAVNRQVVRLVDHQILGAVGGATLEDQALLGANLEDLLVGRMENHARAASLQLDGGSVRSADRPDVQVQRDDGRQSQLVLHQNPIKHAPIRRQRVEIDFAVLHVFAPFDFPNGLRMLPVYTLRHVHRLLRPDLQVVHANVAVVLPDDDQVRILLVDVAAHRARLGCD